MIIKSVLHAGIAGIQKGYADARQHAGEVAAAAAAEATVTTVAKPLVELKNDLRQVEASAQVVRTVDELLGTLLDVEA